MLSVLSRYSKHLAWHARPGSELATVSGMIVLAHSPLSLKRFTLFPLSISLIGLIVLPLANSAEGHRLGVNGLAVDAERSIL